MSALACFYWPVEPCTNRGRTWRTLPAPSQTHSWWDLDSARAALCHTTAFKKIRLFVVKVERFNFSLYIRLLIFLRLRK